MSSSAKSPGIASSPGSSDKQPDYILNDGIKEIRLYESGVDYKGDDNHYYIKNIDGSFSRKD